MHHSLTHTQLSTLITTLSIYFFNDTATPQFYTLSLHDALPISRSSSRGIRCTSRPSRAPCFTTYSAASAWFADRKSTRLNSSHQIISYAVFCLKKKKNQLLTPLYTLLFITDGD